VWITGLDRRRTPPADRPTEVRAEAKKRPSKGCRWRRRCLAGGRLAHRRRDPGEDADRGRKPPRRPGYPVEGRRGTRKKEGTPATAVVKGRRIKYLAPKTGWGGPAAGVLAPLLSLLVPGEEDREGT
jgi:hypothetical protein